MKTHIAAICGALAIGGLTLTAQTPPSPAAGPQAPHHGAEAMAVTGCLKTWDGARGAQAPDAAKSPSAPAAATSIAATKYVLADVETGEAGAGATRGAGPGTATLALKTTETNVDFSRHVNHKVKLTGKIEASAHQAPEARSSGTAGSTGTATPGRDDSALGMAMPTLHVTALEMVSATCS